MEIRNDGNGDDRFSSFPMTRVARRMGKDRFDYLSPFTATTHSVTVSAQIITFGEYQFMFQ